MRRLAAVAIAVMAVLSPVDVARATSPDPLPPGIPVDTAARGAKYQATPTWALVGRYEYVDDSKGGFMTINGKAQSLTITSDHLIAGALKTRLEYRLDHVDYDFFTKSNGTKTGDQSTFTVGLVYGFTGKI